MKLATLGADEADTIEFHGGEFADPSLDSRTWAAAGNPRDSSYPGGGYAATHSLGEESAARYHLGVDVSARLDRAALPEHTTKTV